jgi:hypothetical protein
MTTTAHIDRAAAPAGPPKLTPAQLRAAQAETLDAPRLRYSLLARALFMAMDLAYGRSRTIVKFAMLEFIARVPYQAWERIGYLALARHRRRSALATRVFGRIVQTRAEQDNEQWHLLILQDLVQRRGVKQSFVLHRLAPWLISCTHLTKRLGAGRQVASLWAAGVATLAAALPCPRRAEDSTWHVRFRVTPCMPGGGHLRRTDLPGVDDGSARGTSYR